MMDLIEVVHSKIVNDAPEQLENPPDAEEDERSVHQTC
jgi:hypothetical protein